jgi:hypothetical protein
VLSIFWPAGHGPTQSLAAGLSATSGLAAWMSGTPTTAASLFAALDGASVIWVWDGLDWSAYSMAGTTAIGTDRPITFGSIVFIG